MITEVNSYNSLFVDNEQSGEETELFMIAKRK